MPELYRKIQQSQGAADMAQILQKKQAVSETSEAQIAVHWREEEYLSLIHI